MKRLIVAVLLCGLAGIVNADDGIISKKSRFSPAETLDRLTNVLKKKGINVIARVNHQKNAEGVKLSLRPSELLIFGNPNLGTHFMTSNQASGLDLPMKALAWEDAQGEFWISYNDPSYIANRHGIKDRPEIVKKMTGALDKLTNVAIGDK